MTNKLIEIISLCAQAISKHDGMPQNICSACLKQLLNYNTFRTMCIESNIRLQNILTSNQNYENQSKLEHQYDTENSERDLLVEQEIETTIITENHDTIIIETSFDLDHAYHIDLNDKKIIDEKIEPIEIISSIDPDDNDDYESDQTVNAPDQSKDKYIGINKNERLLCSTCGMWQSQSNLKRHMQTHLGGERRTLHKCPHCDNQYVNRPSFVAHLNRHAGIKPFECQICNKTFHGSNLLRTHMFSHSKTNKFACTDCDKVFRFPHYLSQHRRTHNPPTLYKCNECDYTNVFLHNFKNHMRKHTGVYRFTCDLCGKGFNRKSLFALHQRNYHKENNGN